MKLKNNYVAVESRETQKSSVFAVHDDNVCGVLKFVDESNPELVDLVGKVVYYGPTYVKMNIENKSYRIMKADNLVAVI